MVDAVNGNGAVQYPDDKSKKSRVITDQNHNTIIVPVGQKSKNSAASTLGFIIGYRAGQATAAAIRDIVVNRNEAKALAAKTQLAERQNTIDRAIGGKDGNVNVGTVGSEADLKEILNTKSETLKTKLEGAGYRYGAQISMTGSYKQPGMDVTSTVSDYVRTSYEEKTAALKEQGFEAKKDDKFKLENPDTNRLAELEVEGYDTVTVKKEVIDNRTDENKNLDAVKGAKLGKPDGEAQMVDENTLVQKYQSGAVVQTAYDNPDNPALTITKTTYPDGSYSVNTETKVPIKYGIGSPDSENFVEGILNEGSITEQYTADGELIYRKTKS